MSIHTFNDLVEAVTNAVVHARAVSEKQHFSLLRDYFIKDKNGKLKAKTVEVMVPSLDESEDTHVAMEIPLLNLVPMNSLTLSDVEVELNAVLEGLGGDDAKSKGKEQKRMFFSLKGEGMLKKGNTVKIKISVKGGDPPEGVMRINDRIMKHLP